MNDMVTLKLLPRGVEMQVPRGAALQDLLFAHGVEFPCGGRGQCKRCKLRLIAGEMPVEDLDDYPLSWAEVTEGWRLGCRHRAESNLTLEIEQWNTPILVDDSNFAFEPGEGLGVAVDLGTTTLAAQLLDLRSGKVLGVRTALNPQARFGSDVMSRICAAMTPAGQAKLEKVIRHQIAHLVSDLLQCADGQAEQLRQVVIVGNTPMHNLFCGVPIAPLATYPFEASDEGHRQFQATELGWQLPGNPTVHFLPALGSFVGSDILAGILATRMHESQELVGLIDLGTNGEIVVGNRDHMLCSSTAAGPAFEAARITMGMQATTGAIAGVRVVDGRLECRVLGGGTPRGLCGSGLVDAVACLLDLGDLDETGRMTQGRKEITLAGTVKLSQGDVRELQLAKAAIAVGLRMLTERWGAKLEDLTRLYVAGAFGNYIQYSSAQRIGLIRLPRHKILPAGNTALLGAKLALFNREPTQYQYRELRAKVKHFPLNTDPAFQENFVDELSFPEAVLA